MAWSFDFGAWWHARHIARRVHRTPRATIAAAHDGDLVRVVGRVVELFPLVAPVTGRACIYFDVDVDDPTRHNNWTVIHETGRAPFAIDDDSGRALIDPTGAEFSASLSDEHQRLLADPTPLQRALLVRHDATLEREHLFHERIIAVGATIAIVGIVVREPDPDDAARAAGYRDPPPISLRMTSSPKLPLLISDHDDATR